MDRDQEAERKNLFDALETFQARVTIPILFDTDTAAQILGSGVLFAHDERHFILTAAHLFDPPFDRSHFERLASPDVRTLAKPTTFGPFEFTMSNRKPFDFDIAVIELNCLEKIARLKNEWRFLALEQIGLPTADPLLSIGGYPTELVRESRGAMHGPMFVARTTRLNAPPNEAEPPVDERFDIFCEYATEGDVRLLAKTMPTPRLQGTSGGSLMQYIPKQGALWSADSTMRMIGIQSSGSTERNWFRAKSWWAIAEAFEKRDPELAKTIRVHLGTQG
jgi:hypothetical protein